MNPAGNDIAEPTSIAPGPAVAAAAEVSPVPPQPASPGRLRRWGRALVSATDWTFGLASMLCLLAVLSVVPILNFLSLGYLLHASARVATSGRLRDGFIGIRKAARIGAFVLGSFLVTLPVRVVSGLWKDAEIVAPGSPTSKLWRAGLLVLAVFTVVHIVWATIRGGRFRHFLWPAPLDFLRWLRTSDKVPALRDNLLAFIASLRLPTYLWLGFRGFAGTFLWLLLPVGILLAAAQLAPDKGGAVLSLLGGVLLMGVALYLPFLQVHFAVEDRWSALFAVGAVRRQFQRAPVAFWIALVVTLLFAIPLYLLKIELPPRGMVWLPSLVFVLFILPARLLAGWAMGRSLRRDQPRHAFFRWTARLGFVPVVLFYALMVYLTQYLSWNGSRGLLEQHAFLVPAPWASL